MIKTQEHIKEAIYVISIYCDLLGVKFFSRIKNRNFDYQYIILKNILKYSKVTIIRKCNITIFT
jgi:N-succinyl-L-ornithine transcarbamylase